MRNQARTPLWRGLVVVAALLSPLGCERNSAAPSGAVTTLPRLQMPALPLEQLPDKAVIGVDSTQSGVLVANTRYGSTSLIMMALPNPPPPGNSWPAQGAITLDYDSPQTVAAGRDSLGKAFVVVGYVDYATNQSALHLYTDTTGDGIPDGTAKTVLGIYNNTQLTRAALDASTGTLYVVECLSDSVYRFGDTNGDKKPEGAFTIFHSGTGGIDSLTSPTTTSVLVFPASALSVMSPHRHLKVIDGDGDGVGEMVSAEGPEGRRLPPYGRFANPVFSGDSNASVVVSDTQTWRIDVVAAGGTETVATFTGTTTAQPVSLTRTVQEDERLRIVEAATGASYEELDVRAAQSYVMALEHPADTFVEQGAISFVGRFIGGTELVEAKEAEGTTWTSCTVTGNSSTTLDCLVPELSLQEQKLVQFRITNTHSEEFLFWVRIDPNE